MKPLMESYGEGRAAYAVLLCIMGVFAFLPVIARGAGDASPWTGGVAVAYADAAGLLGTIIAGTFLGAYGGARRITWEGRSRGVIVLVALVAAAGVPLYISNEFAGQPGGETALLVVAAIGSVAAGATGVLLGANLGRLYRPSINLRWMEYKEWAVLAVLSAASFVAAHMQCADAGPLGGADGSLQYAVPILVGVAAVGGVLLGVIYGSYTVRRSVLPYVVIGAMLLLVVIALYPDLPLTAVQACATDIDWQATMDNMGTAPPDQVVSGYDGLVHTRAGAFAVLSLAMAMLTAMLGAHVSVFLKERGGFLTHMRCGTVKWLSRRSIGQLIIIFASPSLPLIALMSVMECGSRSEFGVGVACSLAEMGLMLCGAIIGVLLAFEIYQERKRKGEGRDGRPHEPGSSSPKGSCEAPDKDQKGSSDLDRNSKDTVIIKDLVKGTWMLVLSTMIATIMVSVLDIKMLDTQYDHVSNQIMPGDLFTAAATILGFAVFGSALTIPGQNKYLIMSVALSLIAFGTVQTAFMMSLVADLNMPTTWWVFMTGFWSFWLVLAMAANKSLSNAGGGNTALTR